MFSGAMLLIRDAEARSTAARQRRPPARRLLIRAERFAAELEEIILEGLPTVPRPLADDIRRFVSAHEWGLVPRLGEPKATLDVLFDFQEHVQSRGGIEVDRFRA